MELDFALLATAADVSGGKLNVLGGGFDTFRVPEVPARVPPFFVVARFEAKNQDDREIEHVAVLEIEDPSGEITPFGDEHGGIRFSIPSGNATRAAVVIQLVTEFKLAGQYKLRLLCDGELAKAFDLKIDVIPNLGKRDKDE